MSFPEPLPSIGVDPPQPFPNSTQRVPVDADMFRYALLDVRREMFRARGALLGNKWLGGFAATAGASSVTFGPGVVSVLIPRDGWATTNANNKLVHRTPLDGAGYDGAYRAERRRTTTLQANGAPGHLPETGEAIVFAEYDDTKTDRIALAASTTFASHNPQSVVPLAYVKTNGGVVQHVRDLRAGPAWFPRITQRHYAPDGWRLGDGSLLPNMDHGSYWLTANTGVLFTISVRLRGDYDARRHRQFIVELALSRGDAADGFAQYHPWYGFDQIFPSTQLAAELQLPEGEWEFADNSSWWPTSRHVITRLGHNSIAWRRVFLPRVYTASSSPPDASTTIPAVYHFNGIRLRGLTDRWMSSPKLNEVDVLWASIKSELIWIRQTDVVEASAPTVPRAHE